MVVCRKQLKNTSIIIWREQGSIFLTMEGGLLVLKLGWCWCWWWWGLRCFCLKRIACFFQAI